MAQDTIPAGTYPNQPRDILTVGTPNFLVARADVDEDTVYQMTKSIFENLDTLQQVHPATRQITLEKASASLPVPLHPGAARYFEEKRLPVPILTAGAGDAFLQRYRTSSEAITQVNKNSVGLITGPAGETSARTASELTITLSRDDLRVVAMTSNGSGQNIRDFLYLKGVDPAIVQTDVLRYAAEDHAYPGVEQQIASITYLYDDEVHNLARADITSVDDLGGQPVSVGLSGSGSELTASILFDHLQIAVDRQYLAPYTALQKLRSGEIAVAIFVSGKPITVLDGVEFIDGLHLLPVLSPPWYGDTYRKANFSPYDYPALSSLARRSRPSRCARPSSPTTGNPARCAMAARRGWSRHCSTIRRACRHRGIMPSFGKSISGLPSMDFLVLRQLSVGLRLMPIRERPLRPPRSTMR